MPRDFEQIAKAAAYIQNAQTADETTSLPPGYISGFYATLNPDYTVTIEAGTAYVAGRAVKMESDHLLAGSDWVAPRLDHPNHYYIYLDKSGAIYVDLVQPVYNRGYGYYEQPDFGWRAIAKIFLKNNDIIYCSWNIETGGSTVTVAPVGYTGEADYYCTGSNDDIMINAAILYVYSAYSGGTVKLIEGTFNISIPVYDAVLGYYAINLLSNVTLTGNGKASVLDLDVALPTTCVQIIGSHTNMTDLSIYIRSANNSSGIASDTTSTITGTNIDNVKITGSSKSGSGILLYGSTYVTVSNCYINTRDTAILVGGNNATIESNVLDGNNSGLNFTTSSYSKANDNNIRNNSTQGIEIVSGTSIKITNNYCYNNGSDIGIANTNSNNFLDAGTDTQTYSNSWQSPVAGEPSMGELHPHKAIVISGDDPSLSGWYGTIDLSTEVPVGAKTIFCRLEYRTPTVGRWVILADTSARVGAFELVQYSQVANAFTDTHGFVTLSPTRTFDWYVSNPDIDDVTVQIQGYTS